MARIDTLYLEDPCSGSRGMVYYLAREGIPINRERMQNLMQCMGLRAIYQKQRTMVGTTHHGSWGSICSFSVSGGSQHSHGCGTSLCHRLHL